MSRSFKRMLEVFEQKPRDVEAQFRERTLYYAEWCWRYIFAMFKFSISKEWDYNYFIANLIGGKGMLGITDTEVGVIPLRCSATGINFWEMPTELIFDNPVLKSFTRKINVDCVPLYLDAIVMRKGYNVVEQEVRYYSQLLAQCDGTISQNLMNSRLMAIGEAEDRNQAKTMKAAMECLYNGEPFVCTEVGISSRINILQARNTYVSNEIQDLKRAIKNDFFSTFGYNNTNYNKKARQTVSEVDANNGEIEGGITYWLETLKRQIEKANKMFDLDISIEKREWSDVVKAAEGGGESM